jgi:hypothetical protein
MRPPLPPGAELLARLGYYLQALVPHVNDPSNPPPSAHGIPIHLQIECRQIALVVAAALTRQIGELSSRHRVSPGPLRNVTTGDIKWKVDDYAKMSSGRQIYEGDDEEERLALNFPPCRKKTKKGLFHLVDEACTIPDVDGRIMGWYLPSVISIDRQVSTNPDISFNSFLIEG